MDIKSLYVDKLTNTLVIKVENNDSESIEKAYIKTPIRYLDEETHIPSSDSQAVDITGKFTGAPSEEITINLSDLQTSDFDDSYVLEIKTDEKKHYLKSTSNSIRFDKCILDKLMKLSMCDSCLEKESVPIVNIFMMMNALSIANEYGYLREVISITNALKKVCSDNCKDCGNYSDSVIEINSSEIEE